MSEKRYRVGRKVGRTIYDDGDNLIGVMDTRALAAYFVGAANARHEASTTKLFGPHVDPYERMSSPEKYAAIRELSEAAADVLSDSDPVRRDRLRAALVPFDPPEEPHNADYMDDVREKRAADDGSKDGSNPHTRDR